MFYSALHNRLLAATLAVFCLFLIATVAAWKVTQQVVLQEASNRLYQDSSQIKNLVSQRLELYLLATESLTKSVEIGGDITTASQWSSYIKSLGLTEKYPGVSSLSYSQKVEIPGKTSFIIRYIEPLAGREKAIGYDLTSEENRRRALEKARDTGKVAATGKITLPTTNGPGFGFFFPIYDTKIGPESPLEERRAGLRAIVAVTFRGTEMFRAVYGQTDPFPNLDFEIYQNENLTPANRLYDHDPNFAAVTDTNHHLSTKEIINIDGEKWVIVVTTKNELGFTFAQEILPKVILFSGLLVSLLFLAFFLYQYKLHLASHQAT
ncbi:CHASE domain-containing protein [Candidatus Microgenomates bacterium]|nr:CHASE domain-containing protein [Candidatus Microgenomates bacterium]